MSGGVAALAAGLGGVVLFLGLALLVMVVPRTSQVTATGKPPATRHWKPLLLIEGADGRLSSSKAQWFAWSAVIVGSYVAVFAARAYAGLGVAPTVPTNVLTALGFSTGTMAIAKGVTSAVANQGNKEPPPTAANSQNTSMSGNLLTDDQGITDLSKVQMLTWTVIAVGVYLYTVSTTIASILNLHTSSGLPDIDGTLMVLTGLSQGGYLGKKVADAVGNPVTLSCLVPTTASIGAPVTLYGANFGSGSTDSCLTIDGGVLPLANLSAWKDTKIVFTVPAAPPAGGGWDGSARGVGVVVDGKPSSSTLGLTVDMKPAASPAGP
jgi:hypothetical protein